MQFGKNVFNSTPNESVKIDSIIRVVRTEMLKGQFKQNNPQPIIVTLPSQNTRDNSQLTNSLIRQFKELKNNDERLESYLKVIATKVYKNTYKDSLVTITAIDTISNGALKSQIVNWVVKPQKIKFYEKTITKKLKPKFTFSAGLGITTRLDSLANPQLNGVIGFKNKKGYELQFGISTDKRYNLTFKKDIFTKY
jgi:hypothetical protein